MDSGQDVPARPVTVRDLICSVLSRTAGDFPAEPPAWPPDVFAVTAMVLKRTGAYLCIAGGKGSMATPETEEPFATELPGIQKVAATWQGLAGGDGGSAPAHLQQERAGINVLVIPSPPQVYPSSFTESRRARIDKDSRYFSCKAGALDKDDRQRIIAAASLVEKEHGRLDVLVLPETAASTADFEDLCYELGEWAAEKLPTRDGIVVVAGVVADVAESANAETGRPAHRNNVAVSSQLAGLRI